MASHAPAAKKTAVPAKGIDGFTGRALDLDDTPQREEPRSYRCDESVIVATTMHATDEPRFQQIHNMFKNKNTELATEVVSMMKRQKNKEEARQWMATNVGTPPGMKLTVAELIQIALVALALAKYGIAALNDWYDRKQLDAYVDFPLRSDELRSVDQKKYREQSKSTQKDGKDVAHYVGLDFVVKLNRDLPEQHRVASEPLKALLNDFENLRLVKLETNRGLHKEVDALLLRVYNGELIRLTAVQRERVGHIVRFCQSKVFQSAMLDNRGVYLYAKIRGVMKRVESNRVGADEQPLWSDQLDRPGLQAAAASARLNADGTPDRRFKENKVLSDRELNAAVLAQRPSRPANDDTANKQKTSSNMRTRDGPQTPPLAPTRAPSATRSGAPSARATTSSSGQSGPAAATRPVAASKATPDLTARPVDTVNSRQIFEGPKGGRYYINDLGKKVYVKS